MYKVIGQLKVRHDRSLSREEDTGADRDELQTVLDETSTVLQNIRTDK